MGLWQAQNCPNINDGTYKRTKTWMVENSKFAKMVESSEVPKRGDARNRKTVVYKWSKSKFLALI